jgi:hypothetical protein
LAASTQKLIEGAVQRFQAELPALANLKLAFELNLRGRGDVQIFLVELPGPTITKTLGGEAPIKIEMPRAQFNELAEDGKVKQYRDAYEAGNIRVDGDEQIKRLIGEVVRRHEERARLKKAH